MRARNEHHASLRATFAAAALVAAALGLLPVASAQPAPASVTLAVEGMHCGSCAERIEDVLGRLDGVVSADVTFDQRRAVVRYDSRRVDVARIIRAIEDAGFSARLEGPDDR